jgi:hypothetical protein
MAFFHGRSAAITAALFLLLSNAEAFLNPSASNVAFSRVKQTSSTQVQVFDFINEGKMHAGEQINGVWNGSCDRAIE